MKGWESRKNKMYKYLEMCISHNKYWLDNNNKNVENMEEAKI